MTDIEKILELIKGAEK